MCRGKYLTRFFFILISTNVKLREYIRAFPSTESLRKKGPKQFLCRRKLHLFHSGNHKRITLKTTQSSQNFKFSYIFFIQHKSSWYRFLFMIRSIRKEFIHFFSPVTPDPSKPERTNLTVTVGEHRAWQRQTKEALWTVSGSSPINISTPRVTYRLGLCIIRYLYEHGVRREQLNTNNQLGASWGCEISQHQYQLSGDGRKWFLLYSTNTHTYVQLMLCEYEVEGDWRRCRVMSSMAGICWDGKCCALDTWTMACMNRFGGRVCFIDYILWSLCYTCVSL